MNCKDCKYTLAKFRGGERKFLGKTVPPKKVFYCKHPNQEYIENFLLNHRIYYKETGEICFSDGKGNIKIKTSPNWCPLKAEKG